MPGKGGGAGTDAKAAAERIRQNPQVQHRSVHSVLCCCKSDGWLDMQAFPSSLMRSLSLPCKLTLDLLRCACLSWCSCYAG